MLNNRGNQGREQSILDLRQTGQVGVAQPKPVVLTGDAWSSLQKRCREMDDDEFHVIRTRKSYIEFSLTDRDGKPQQYCIRVRLLKRIKRATGKKLFALFLVFEKDGYDVVDTAQYWFEPFKPWLKYWAGKGICPKHLKQITGVALKAMNIGKQIGGYKRFSEH